MNSPRNSSNAELIGIQKHKNDGNYKPLASRAFYKPIKGLSGERCLDDEGPLGLNQVVDATDESFPGLHANAIWVSGIDIVGDFVGADIFGVKRLGIRQSKCCLAGAVGASDDQHFGCSLFHD